MRSLLPSYQPPTLRLYPCQGQIQGQGPRKHCSPPQEEGAYGKGQDSCEHTGWVSRALSGPHRWQMLVVVHQLGSYPKQGAGPGHS